MRPATQTKAMNAKTKRKPSTQSSYEQVEAERLDREAQELVPLTVFITPEMKKAIDMVSADSEATDVRQYVIGLLEDNVSVFLHGNCGEGNWWCAVGEMQGRAAAGLR